MHDYRKSLFLENVFSAEELAELQDHFDQQPVAHHYQPQNTVNKNLDYDIAGTPVNRIVKPRLSEILQDSTHQFFGGAYKEYTIPYPLHVDNVIPTAKMTFRAQARHSTAFLIPMMERPELQTAIFDVHFPVGHNFNVLGDIDKAVAELTPSLLDHDTEIDRQEFDHIQEPFWSMLPRIPIDRIQTWRLGSVLTWHFDQLHCSTNFQRYDITKKFMVIFIN